MRFLRPILALLAVACGAISGSASAQTVIKYVHTDALGSVVALTDSTGAVVERREYEPYGSQLTPGLADGPGYTGHVQDVATGLTYMQQRYYDPLLGIFVSVDPVTPYDSALVHFNRYLYANNNPYLFIDPDGRCGTRIKGNTTPNCGSIQINPSNDSSEAGGGGSVPTIADLNRPAAPPPTRGESIKQFSDDVVDEAWNRWLPAIPGGAGAATGLKVLAGGVMAVRLTRAVNLPAWSRLSVNMPHIVDRHMVGGTMTQGRSIFIGLNERGVMAAVRQAYGSSSVVRHQGDRMLLSGSTNTGMRVEMWLNRSTNTIETAYPVIGR